MSFVKVTASVCALADEAVMAIPTPRTTATPVINPLMCTPRGYEGKSGYQLATHNIKVDEIVGAVYDRAFFLFRRASLLLNELIRRAQRLFRSNDMIEQTLLPVRQGF